MSSIKKIVFALILFLTNIGAYSQTFNLAGFTTDNYPKVKASFIALKADETSYTDLKVEDFRVLDNGKLIPNANLELECSDPPLSIVLVVDQSGSMTYNQPVDDNNWVWAKEAIDNFLSQVILPPGSSIALTTFGSFSYLRSGFVSSEQNYRQIIIDSLNTTEIGGGTNFNRAFFGDPINPPFETGIDSPINLLKNSPPASRRIIVFLTDGLHDIYNGPVLLDSIIRTMNNHNIQLYGVTLRAPYSNDIYTITSYTGGKYFIVDNKIALQKIYSGIAENLNNILMCSLTWETAPACDEISTFREADITFLRENIRQRKSYKLPTDKISRLESDKIMIFGNLNINSSETQSVVVRATNADYTILDLKTVPDTYFKIADWGDGKGVKPSNPITIKKGDSLTLKVRFTQLMAKEYRQASLQVIADPCNAEITLTGGLSKIKLISPQAGEVFSTCDTVLISWAGVDVNSPVQIQFSTNSGIDWKTITNSAKGFTYKWVPSEKSKFYKIRVNLSPVPEYKWALSAGGSGDDHGTSLAIKKDAPFFYVGGYFEGSSTFGKLGNYITKTSEGDKDAFLAKYDFDGNVVWVETAGSKSTDSIAGVATSSNGSVYVVGTFFSSAKFGAQVVAPDFISLPYFFVARYSSDGGTPTIRYIGAEGYYNNPRCWGESIYVDEEAGRIYARGKYTGELVVNSKNIYLPGATSPTAYTAVYTTNMEIIQAFPGWDETMNDKFSTNSDFDNQSYEYKTGSFAGTAQFGSNVVISSGKSDISITRYGAAPSSSDELIGTFTVEAPMPFLVKDIYDFGSATLGSYTNLNFEKTFVNTGTIPLAIEQISIKGAHPGDFSIAKDYVGNILQPGESIDLQMTFNPKDLNLRAAVIEIVSSCNVVVTAQLKGNGTCDAVALPFDFGRVSKNNSVEEIVPCLFYNSNDAEIQIRPILTSAVPAHKNMFKLFDKDNNEITESTIIRVGARECVEIKFIYSPTDIDKHSVTIDFRMPAACTPVYSVISGESYDADLFARPIHWELRRAASINDSLLVIENNNDVPVRILNKDIKLQNPNAEGEFVIDLSKFTEQHLVIPANSSLEVPISFRPKRETQYRGYSNSIIINVEFRDEPLVVDISGTGFLPEISASYVCVEEIKVGQIKTSYLSIKNTSKYSVLNINRISIDQGIDFSAAQQADFLSRKVNPGQEVIIPIVFSPKNPGYAIDVIRIENDAFDGTFLGNFLNTTLDTKCEVLGIDYTQGINFGTSLICESSTRAIRIENMSGSSDLIIAKSDIELAGNDPSFFSIDLVNDLTIKPGSFAIINLEFLPIEARAYSAIVNIENSLGFPISIPVSANSAALTATIQTNNIEIVPGARKPLTFFAEVPAIDNHKINEIEIVMDYNSTMISFVANSLKTEISGWTWTADIRSSGKIVFQGNGEIASAFNGKLFTINFTAYLSEMLESDISYEVVYSCNTLRSLSNVKIKLAEVCFLEGRLINLSDTRFSLAKPSPNPVSTNLEVTYGVGFDVETTIELFNSNGELIRVIEKSLMKKGIYTKTIGVDDLPSGVYMLRMTSGPYLETHRIVIQK